MRGRRRDGGAVGRRRSGRDSGRARRRCAARPRSWKYSLVLDDAGDVEPSSGSPGDLDGVGGALVGVDPTEEQQVVAGFGIDGEGVGVDPVVDGGGVVQRGVAIGVADRDVVGRGVVALVDRDDPRRREPVDRRDDRRVDEAAVGEREEVEPVVDDVELVGSLEHRRRCAGTRRPWGRSTRPPTTRSGWCRAAWRSSPSRRWRTA